MLRLRIKLLSPLCAGAGIGTPGFVDREIAFDPDTGLPYIPARRLKGLLRDSYNQLLECLDTSKHSRDRKCARLFGKIGDSASGPVKVGDAIIEDAAAVSEWLKDVLGSDLRDTVTRTDVTAIYTDIRRQTAIDPATNAPQQNTLRATRTIHPATFEAIVEGVTGGDLDSLALAAAALQQMGTSRSRGMGRVQCTLWDEDKTIDLTKAALEKLEKGEWQPGLATDTQLQKPAVGIDITLGGEPTYILRFQVELLQTAMFPSTAGDPNTVRTDPYVPGSVIHGALSWAYLKGRVSPDNRFHQLFSSGNVLFLPAYPAIRLTGGERRSIPVPHSVREEKPSKDQNGIPQFGATLNLAGMEPDEKVEGVKRVHGGCVLSDAYQGELYRENTRTQLHYHHARSDDRRRARALAPEETQAGEMPGTLFVYESVLPGQTFLGAILGSEEDLRDIQKLVADKTKLDLGRSKAAQYGGKGEWKWLDDEPKPLNELGPEENSWRSADEIDADPANEVVVTLLSPMLSVNECGHPSPEFPVRQLEQRLGVTFKRSPRAFVRTSWVGGYLSHQRLPMQQFPALDAGSVFVFEVGENGNGPEPDRMIQACVPSYGMRIEDGFGRIALHYRRSLAAQLRRRKPDAPPPGQTAVSPGTPAAGLAQKLFRRRILALAEHDGVEESTKVQSVPLANFSNHLLYRLIGIVERQAVPQLKSELDKLRELAKKRIRTLLVDKRTVGEFIVEKTKAGDALIAELSVKALQGNWAKILGNSNPEIADGKPIDRAFAETVVKTYLLRFLGSLAWRKREMLKKGESAG